jgi:hypothetical protein
MVIQFASSAPARQVAPAALPESVETIAASGSERVLLQFRSRPRIERTPDPDYAAFADKIDWLFASLPA